MRTPETSRLFTRFLNPSNGIENFVLTHRQAPVQRPFYFTNPSYSDDGRFLWIECAFPPNGGREAVPVLGVVDFEKDELRIYHETQWTTARPVVDLQTAEVYWGNGLNIWKRGPLPNDESIKVASFPAALAQGRKAERIATHLTFSADRKALNMDAWIDNDCYIGEYRLDGSESCVWQQGSRTFNHAQFSPIDPDHILIAHEYWQDPTSGKFDPSRRYHRMYTIRRGETAIPVLAEPVTHSGHEWWDADGKHIWYVHYGVGIKRVDLATGTEALLWPGHLAHGMSDQTSRYVVADSMEDPSLCDCRVDFRDLKTGKEVRLVAHPPLNPTLTQCGHLHPHPHFCLHDRYVCYTTTVHNRVDVAIASTDHLREVTA